MTKWISCYKPKPDPKKRLFCFSHAGGSAQYYNSWQQVFPEEVELCLIQYPGRWDRYREPLIDSMPEMVESLLAGIQHVMDLPFAFFGHSLGGLIAFECACQCCKSNDSNLKHLFISSCMPPRQSDISERISHLPDQEFTAALANKYGGIPKEILEEPELLEMFLPIVRSDMRLYENYQYQPQTVINAPITVFYGLQDKTIDQLTLQTWGALTTSQLEMYSYVGEHFLTVENSGYVQTVIIDKLGK